MKKQLDPALTSKFVEFSTKVPAERLQSIRQALGVSPITSTILRLVYSSCPQRFLPMDSPSMSACVAATTVTLRASLMAAIQQFGLTVQPDARPLDIPARVLAPPTLRYGAGSRQQTIVRTIPHQPRYPSLNRLRRTHALGRGTCECSRCPMHRQIVDDSTRVDKKFYKPASFERWVVIVYENERRFNMQTAQGVV